MPVVGGQRYYTSTAVFMNEVLKLAFSLTMALYDIATDPKVPDTSTAAGLFGELGKAVFTDDSWKMAIPAMLYTLQNSLQYVGLSNLDAVTFQVTYQLKILTTALFSVTLLGRSLGLRRWLSLLLLTIGIAIVQIPTKAREAPVLSMKDLKDGVAFHSPRSIWNLKALGNVAAGQLSKRSATYEGIDEDFAAAHPQINATVGLIAVAIACVLSGMAGVYFEKILKDAKGDARSTSVWVRNVQLSFYSLWPALFIGVFFIDGEHIAKTGFFTGYSPVVWLAITFQAMGGVIVALVVKYADNILKNFATSISIIVSSLASVIFFDFHITPVVSPKDKNFVCHADSHCSTCSALLQSWVRRICITQQAMTGTSACHPSAYQTTRRAASRPTSTWSLHRPWLDHRCEERVCRPAAGLARQHLSGERGRNLQVLESHGLSCNI